MPPSKPLPPVASLLGTARAVTVLTGAGISTDSGIPDFRGPQGVWTKDPAAQRMVSLDAYVADRDLRVRAWHSRMAHPAWTAEPNAGHDALVALERSGRLRALVTQNIDGLHRRAGNDAARVLEIHGTLFEAECLSCDNRVPMRAVLDRVGAGEPDPPCLRCGGILKSATVSFGQPLDPSVLAAAIDAARECDLFLAVGTTLQVQPAASLVRIAVESGARLVIVNRDPTPYDDAADVRLGGSISEVLPRLVAGAAS